MPSLGAEISAKIKSAIRAKLVELDVYVDDELPDYIMVLAANKKPIKQMEDDLGLFLGTHTKSFVDWLEEILDRLKSLSGQSTDESQHGSEKNAKTKPVKIKKKKADKLHKQKVKGNKIPIEAQSNEVKQVDTTDGKPTKETQGVITRPTKRKKGTKKDDVSSSKKHKKNIQKPSELKQATKKRKIVSASASVSKSSGEMGSIDEESSKLTDTDCKHPRIIAPFGAIDTTNEKEDNDILTLTAEDDDLMKQNSIILDVSKKPVSSNKTQLVKSASRKVSVVSASTESENHHSSGVQPLRTRKSSHSGLVSTVGAIVSHQVNDDYDPINPVVGTVASRIQISERRKLPVKLQPKPTLLLKAMRDAQRSTVASVKPFLVRETLSQKRKAEGTCESRGNDLRSKLKGSSSHSDTQHLSAHSKVSPKTKDYKLSRYVGNPENIAITVTNDFSVKQHKVSEETKSLQKVSYVTKHKITPESSPIPEDFNDESSDEEDGVHVTIGNVTRNREEADDETPKDPLSAEYITSLVHHAAGDSSMKTAKTTASEPTFVVTLTGLGDHYKFDSPASSAETLGDVNSASLEEVEEVVIEEEVVDEAAELRSRLLEEKALKKSVITPPKPSTVVPDTLLERCKFWPGCKSGTDCVYVHPSSPCSAFPKCTMADKCLYIHPPCKFDVSCTKSHCPFAHSHTGQRHTPAASSFAVNCKFSSNCTRPNCSFQHPKPCRYGDACNNPVCAFTHTASGAASKQYTWVSSSARLS